MAAHCNSKSGGRREMNVGSKSGVARQAN